MSTSFLPLGFVTFGLFSKALRSIFTAPKLYFVRFSPPYPGLRYAHSFATSLLYALLFPPTGFRFSAGMLHALPQNPLWFFLFLLGVPTLIFPSHFGKLSVPLPFLWQPRWIWLQTYLLRPADAYRDASCIRTHPRTRVHFAIIFLCKYSSGPRAASSSWLSNPSISCIFSLGLLVYLREFWASLRIFLTMNPVFSGESSSPFAEFPARFSGSRPRGFWSFCCHQKRETYFPWAVCDSSAGTRCHHPPES